MQRSEIETLLSALGGTAEIMGTELKSSALMIMAEDLSEYSINDVLLALKRCRQEVSGRLTLAAIIERIQSADGMPGAEEAWAIVSQSENETFVMTEQMAEALGTARPLLEYDRIAARMAFKDAYTRLVSDARAKRLKPRWFLSAGHDRQGRAGPIAEAIRTGRLGLDHAIGLLGPDEKAEVLQLTGNHNHPFLLQYKQAQLEEKQPLDIQAGMKRIEEIKKQLAMKSA